MGKALTKQLAERFGIVGESPAMLQAVTRLLQVAPTDLTVLITGETGTGKEVFAHAVHELSGRKRQPFVSVNCGAIPETLLESELFGAEKGAYTGSVEKRKGFFESADKGTIFLDEIGEMPIGTQVKLLRILESGEFSRLGSSDVHKVDVRVIAATNRDLLYEVRQGRFRQDLYFRLQSVNIHLPPLRQHTEDIPLLVEHFARRVSDKGGFTFQGIDDAAISVLESFSWHGNVRELRNVIETAVTLERGARITAEMMERYRPHEHQIDDNLTQPAALVRVMSPDPVVSQPDIQTLYRAILQLTADINEIKTVLRALMSMAVGMQNAPTTASTDPIPSSPNPPVEPSLPLSIPDLEKMAIERALQRSGGNRREAAEILGLSERTLYRKIQDYGL